jgi:predicted ATPase
MKKDISVLPKELPGEDLFEGKSHEHIADTILEQIKNGKSKLIGIEGKWGSGKSNILKIIEKKIKEMGREQEFIFSHIVHGFIRMICIDELYRPNCMNSLTKRKLMCQKSKKRNYQRILKFY